MQLCSAVLAGPLSLLLLPNNGIIVLAQVTEVSVWVLKIQSSYLVGNLRWGHANRSLKTHLKTKGHAFKK